MLHRLALGVLGAVVSTACGTILGTSEDPPTVGNGDGGAGADGRSEGATTADAGAAGDGAASDAGEAGDAGNTSKVVFVTSGLTQGDLRFGASATMPSGRLVADAHCAVEAAEAGLGGTFVAWISTGNSSAVALLGDGVRWVRTDGRLVFPSKASISAGNPPSLPIDRDARGAVVDGDADGGSAYVWTGTQNNGMSAGDPCANWSTTGAGGQGRHGVLASTQFWSDLTQDDTCEKFKHVLCFQK